MPSNDWKDDSLGRVLAIQVRTLVLILRTHVKLEAVAYVCNSSMVMLRWEVKTGDVLESFRPGCLLQSGKQQGDFF